MKYRPKWIEEGEINKIRCVFVRMQTSTRMVVYGTALFVGRDFQHSDFRDLSSFFNASHGALDVEVSKRIIVSFT
jgi:hypothetical protein